MERKRGALHVASTYGIGPLAGACVTALDPNALQPQAAIVSGAALACGTWAVHARERRAFVLPLMGAVVSMAGPLLGVMALVLCEPLIGSLGIGPLTLAAILLTATASVAVGRALLARLGRPTKKTRLAVIGSADEASTLAEELRASQMWRYEVLGRVARGPNDAGSDQPDHDPLLLGSLEELEEVIIEHRVDLLVMTASAPRLAVAEELCRSCLHLPVRFSDLSDFCERVFGHVPVTEIGAPWFQHMLHPNFPGGGSPVKRLLDLLIAAVALVLAVPGLAVLGLLIRRDGGPMLFKQARIGEGGRPFRLYKLRTMHAGMIGPAEWSSAGDDRVTRVGRFLRRSHLDELPQLFNVLKGEMSMVGPRPEQPDYVEALEELVPFYSRRHLVKPGITGWAQVRCGYAGSEEGSAWKMCHDLYYIKHRSLGLDMLILAETLRTFVSEHQYEPDLRRSPRFAHVRLHSAYAQVEPRSLDRTPA